MQPKPYRACPPWPLVVAALAALCATQAPAKGAGQVVDTIERNFQVTGRCAVVIRNVDGRTRVSAGDPQTVKVRAVKEVFRAASNEEAERAAAEVKVRIEQVGGRIEVEALYPKNWFSFGLRPSVHVHFEVGMPAEGDLEAHSVDGVLDVNGISGRLDLATVDGNLECRNCSGRIDAHTVDGDLLLESVRGELKAHSVDGDVRILGALNVLDVSTIDGGIEVTAEGGSRMDRDWSVQSSDGNVQLQLPAGFAADLDVDTGDGRIINDHPVTVQGELSRHRLTGRLNSGGALLRIRTSDGDVSIRKI
jgi:hypothetical protein